MTTHHTQKRKSPQAVLRMLVNQLGPDCVAGDRQTIEQYSRTTLPSAPRPSAVVYAQTRAEVETCLKIASRSGCQVYPISGGKNWGLGSACPTTEGQIILDLSGMNRILEIDEELGYAVIEPGVTQQQLHDELQRRQAPFWMDSTGAGPHATIIGNLMERGYGHNPYGDRFHHSCGYEVVLSDGSVVRTGWSHLHAGKIGHLFKTGLGPSLDGLFTQSNLGVVTRATIWLLPQPERFEGYGFRLSSESQLAEVIDALRPLRSLGVINSVVHLANDYRVISAHKRFPYAQCSGADPLPEHLRESFRRELGVGRWNVLGGIYGTSESVKGTRRAIARALRGIVKPIFISDSKLKTFDRIYAAGGKWLPAVQRFKRSVDSARSALELLKGRPVGDHLAGGGWRSRTPWSDRPTDPLDRGDGVIWLTPLIPMSGTETRRFLSLVEPIFDKFGFEPLLTLVMISGKVMCCPTTICYDKQDESQSIAAQACYQELLDSCLREGFPPYRAGIQSMRKLFGGEASQESLNQRLKGTFDPTLTIAPGRYC